MILTEQQINEILSIVDFHHLFVISTNFGKSVLSKEDEFILSSHGVDISKLPNITNYDKMYMFGTLSQILGDQNTKTLSYNDLFNYVKSGQYFPLTKREKEELEIARKQTYTHLKGLKQRVKSKVETSIYEMEKTSREQYESAIQQGISEGVAKRKSVSKIISDIGHSLNEWKHDWGRIVETEMNNVFLQARATQIKEKRGGDALVYKQPYITACRHCIRLYLTKGLGSQPILFKLSQLEANGTNIGLKVQDWKSTLGSVHPYCFGDYSTPIYTSKGWIQIKNIKVGDLVLTHKGRFKKVTDVFIRDYDDSRVFNISVRTSDKYTVSLRKITYNHPILTNKGWVNASDIKIGDKLNLLQDLCNNTECKEKIDLYKRNEENFTSSDKYHSLSCGLKFTALNQWKNEENRKIVSEKAKKWSRDRMSKMTKEERVELTKNARKRLNEKYPNQSSPFHNYETRIRANRTNGRRCTFIELKLRYFLDQLGIKYETDFFIKRKEVKSNGQNKVYFPDIYIKDLNIVIEADGVNWHEDVEYDNKRDKEIKELIGADTFRFSEEGIRNNGDKVFEEIKRIVKNHRGEFSFREVEVVSIEEFKREFYKKGIKKLYNFSVEEDESYIANGIIVHNCKCPLYDVLPGYKWNNETKKFELPKEWERKVERRSKVKIQVGEKYFEV